MVSMLANIVVAFVILGLAALAVRSLWKNHKRGGGCVGCPGGCEGCHGSCSTPSVDK